MKRAISIILVIALLLAIGIVSVIAADSDTIKVSGNISSDTSWNKAGSTYVLDGDIQIKNGVTLSIGKNVTVDGSGNEIKVFGTLSVDESILNNVRISARNTNDKPCTINLTGNTMTGGTLLAPTGNEAYVYLTIQDNVFKDMDEYTYIWYPSDIAYITGNIFEKCGGLSIGSNYDVYVTNNVFSKMTTDYAVKNWAQYNNSQCHVNKNSFYDTGVVLRLEYDSGKMDGTSNYWNTSDEEEVAKRIVDEKTDFETTDTIEYLPILSSPDKATPKYPITPEPTPSASETVKPSESPKPSETVKPSESPKPSETVKPSESPKPSETVKPSESPKPSASPAPSDFPDQVTAYDDVPEESWYTIAVYYAESKRYMTGIGGGKFNPNGTVTRGTIVQVLYAAEGKPTGTKSAGFSDVKAEKWYTDAVNWAASKGFVAGYPDGSFKPEKSVTREELATILYKYAQSKTDAFGIAMDALDKYSDKDQIHPYAVNAMEWAVTNKLISGTDRGLEPRGTATRAQLAVMLQAFDKLIQ